MTYLITIGSTSRSFRRKGIKKVLIRLISYLALVNPKTGNVLQYLSKCSSKTMSWFFAFEEAVLSYCRLPPQYQHSDYDVGSVFLGYVQVNFLLRFFYGRSSFSVELYFA